MIYLVIFFSTWILVIFYMNYSIGNLFPDKIEKNIEITQILDIERKKLFDAMTDLKNYPTIFPNNVLSVTIINQSKNVIFAEEQFIERGITANLVVKHTIFPYEKHIITIMDGDAKNSTVTVTFEDLGSSTKLTVQGKMNLKGILILFGVIPEQQFAHAINTVISGFVDYARTSDDLSITSLDLPY